MNHSWKMIALLFSLSFFVACTPEDDSPEPTPPITEEEAAELVEAALIEETDGIAKEAAEATSTAETYALEANCGLSGDTSIIYTIDRPNITGAYSTELSWELICEGPLPTELQLERSMSGAYSTARISSNDTASSTWSISELLTGPEYVMNGNYLRSGTQEFAFQEERSFETSLEVIITDLRMEKTTQEVNSGLGTFELNVTASNGTTTTITGSVEFIGNQTGIISFNGNSYTIAW
jgi:hypothetical protein